MRYSIIIMGVSGCGKTTLAEPLAQKLAYAMIEGDVWHPQANVEKMRNGIALQDADRAGWLDALAQQMELHPEGSVLTCSALKKIYRDRLRLAHAPAPRFVHLVLTPEQAKDRVCKRQAHFFNPALVDSQFATLESPTALETDARDFDALLPIEVLIEQVLAWLAETTEAPAHH